MIKYKLKKRYNPNLQDQFKIEVCDNDNNNIFRFSAPSEERDDANCLYVEIEGQLNDTGNHDEPTNPMTKEEIETWFDTKEAE
jgi:hypothetical protein